MFHGIALQVRSLRLFRGWIRKKKKIYS